MKLIAHVFDGRKEPRKILLDSGNGTLEVRIEDVLPGMRVLGVFTYPALDEISIHVAPEVSK